MGECVHEVKALTEYEDGRVSRLMTVVAFLSALVGAVFTRCATLYSWPTARFAISGRWLLPLARYLTFIIYVTLVSVAVLLLILAIRPPL